MSGNSERGRAQVRGARRGRGRGHGLASGGFRAVLVDQDNAVHSGVVLHQIRAQRQVTRSHLKPLPGAVGEELMQRKRLAQLHQVVKPRKRCARNPSLQRSAPVFAAVAEPLAIATVESAPQNLGLPEPQDSGLLELEAYPATQLQWETIGAEFEVQCDSTDNNFEEIGDWLNLMQTDSDDEELNGDDNDYVDTIPLLTRTATDQIADNSGLSSVEIVAVQQEEEASNRHLRNMVMSNDNYFEFDWTDDETAFTGKREVFTGTQGPTFPVTQSTRPIDIFYQMFDSDFIDLMVTETNRYGENVVSAAQLDSTLKNARSLRWTPTDRNEMVAFLAVIILQGLYPKVKEEAYFSYDGFGTTPYFSRIMSFNRYHLLKTFHHFIDNNTTTDLTKLNKIRPVIDYFNDKFSSLYYPGQEIVIDESLLKRQGRLSFAQKISTKAAQADVKTYELCESSTGYLWKFIVYTGKDGQYRARLDTEQGQQANDESDQRPDNDQIHDDGQRPDNIAKIIFDLITPLLHKGHTLIMDDFYNSPLLARCLKRDGRTDVYGTLRLSRKFVPETIKTLTKKDMRQGEVVVTYCSDLSVMLWRDSNFVGMISTYHPLRIGAKQTHNRLTYKPKIVLDYNKSMGGFHRKDQYLAGQPLERHRNKVWYKNLFRRLYNTAIFNCFVMFTSDHTHRLTHRKFRTILAEELLTKHKQIDLTLEPRLLTRNTKTTETSTTRTLTILEQKRPYIEGNHFPAPTNSRATRCKLCSQKKQLSRTAYKCEECNVNLCILGCFKEYHKPPM